MTGALLDTLNQLLATVEPAAANVADICAETMLPSDAGDSAAKRTADFAAHLARSSDRLVMGEVLGEGGMGVVRLAEQPNLGRQVAVKAPKAGHSSEQATIEVLREAWVTGTLEHPNIVPVYFIDSDSDGRPLIVLKRIEGKAWSEVMHAPPTDDEQSDGRDPIERNLDILLRVIDGIRYAHSRHIVHRDLKPDNVMIGEFGEVYILDWGIAVSMSDDDTPLQHGSRAKQLAGTPFYMAPEMANGSGVDERTDVYLLGGVLYEILCGHAPHTGKTLEEVIASVDRSRPEFPETVPAELKFICQRAMSAERADRYPSASALERDIREFLGHRHSAQLAHRASATVEELRDLIKEDATDSIYERLGECRFAFRAALDAWSENQVASRGLQEAVELVIEYELDRGHPRIAATLARDLVEPAAELEARIERAVKVLADQETRAAQRDRDLDSSIGQRTRAFVFSLFGVLWTGIPVFLELTGLIERIDYAVMNGIIVAFTAFCGGVFYWARESLSKTAFNRQAALLLMILLLVHLPLNIAAERLAVPEAVTQIIWLLLWCLTAALATVFLERRMWPSILGCLTGFAVAATWPELRMWAMAGTLTVFSLNGLVLWGDAINPWKWHEYKGTGSDPR